MLIITGLVLGVFIFLIGKAIYDENRKFDLRAVLACLVFTALYLFNSCTSDLLFTALAYYIGLVLFFEISFNCSMKEIVLGSLVIYTCKYFILVVLELLIIALDLANYFTDSHMFLNVLSLLITYILVKKTRMSIKKFMNKTGRANYAIIIELIIINLILAFFSIISNGIDNWVFSPESWFIITCVVVINLLTAKLVNEEHKNSNINKSYLVLAKYSAHNEKILEEYRMSLHESGNQLLVIKSMLDGTNEDVDKYIDQVLDSKYHIKSEWLNELKNVPFTGVKGFVNHKITEMQEKGINVELIISPQIKKFSKIKLTTKEKEDFYNIIGVYLDNAKEAAAKSKLKMVSIIAYIENKNIKILFANTYKGKISMKRLNEYGYSTKGKNHGTGLKLVTEIVNKSKTYNTKTALVQNFFLQALTVNIYQKPSKNNISP